MDGCHRLTGVQAGVEVAIGNAFSSVDDQFNRRSSCEGAVSAVTATSIPIIRCASTSHEDRCNNRSYRPCCEVIQKRLFGWARRITRHPSILTDRHGENAVTVGFFD